jgi:hypothetical protein
MRQQETGENQPSLHKQRVKHIEILEDGGPVGGGDFLVPRIVPRGAHLPKWLTVPEADNRDRDAGNETVAGEAEGEVCDV